MLRYNYDNALLIWSPEGGELPNALEEVLDGNGDTVEWRFTPSDNVTETYDATGKLLSIVDVQGNVQTLSYDTSNRLDRVDTNTGEYIQFGYDTQTPQNRVSSITDVAGRIWIYRYDTNNNLEYVDNPDGTTKQYHYEDTNYLNSLTGITDERSIRYATYAYDTQGRAIASYHAGNAQRVDISYNDTDGTRTVTNSLGQPSTYSTVVQLGMALVTDVSGPGCSTCGTGDTAYNYDPANNDLLSKTENGITTKFGQYDSKDQYGCKAEGITAADTSTGECAFDPVASPDARRTDYTYDSRFFNKITSITEPSVYPGNSKVTTTTYGAFGNRLSETVTGFAPDGQGGYVPVSRTTTRQYAGPLNQLSFGGGPRTDVNDYTYYRYYPNDTSQPIGTRARLKEIQDANGVLTRSNIQYTATGKVQSESRPNGLTLTYTYYPGNDRLEKLTESDGTDSRETRWEYFPTGEVKTITTGYNTPDATTLTFGYDDARRLTRITDGLGNYIEYTLDTERNRLSETTYDGNGTPLDPLDDVLTKQFTQTFDMYNRLEFTAQANETTYPTFAPDGTLDSTTDGNNAITDYSYDALRRLTQVTQDLNGSGPTADTITTYDYDVQDRLTSVTDPNIGITTYAYDDLGNLLSQTSPDTGTTSFTYDTAGNLLQKTDALGAALSQVFTYSYDVLNRLTALNAPGSADDIGYAYDTCQNGTGRLCRITYGGGALPDGNQVHYQYTAFGDIRYHQGSDYQYDASGRVQTLTYPSGAMLTYSYDSSGQISQLDLTVDTPGGPLSETLASSISHAPFGPVTALTYGNAQALTHSFDSAYRLDTQKVEKTAAPAVTALDRSLYMYDANGNRLSHSDALATPSLSSFSFDALNRLDTASGLFGSGVLSTRDYDYDDNINGNKGNGNRTQLIADGTTIPATYEPNSNRLKSLGGDTVMLDENGNTLSNGIRSYSYTPHNRLSDATEAATLKATFVYNGLGQRITKTDESTGTTRHYLYSRSGELLAEVDSAGHVRLEYIYLDGQLLALYSPDVDQDGIPDHRDTSLPAVADADLDTLPTLDEWLSYGTDPTNTDSDGDGVTDDVEVANHTDPTLPGSILGDGDVNHDGVVNLGDLVLLYQYVLGLKVPDADALTHGDMNVDGQLTIPDLLLLQKLLLQSRWEVVTNWRLAMLDWLVAPSQASLPGNSGALYYVHNDPLGAPQALTDESGTVVWTAGYDPFGKAAVNEDPDGDGNSVTLNVRFPGQYYDNETGLHYNYFRYYDPAIGRYITADPIGQFLGIHPVPNIPRGLFNYVQTLQDLELASSDLNHLYAYVSSNPVGSIDPYGLLDFNASVGAGGSFHVGPVGLGATTSIAGDTNGRICVVTQVCGTFGMGIFGNLGISGSIGTGALCEGAAPSGGFFAEGGAGITGSGSITTNGNGGTVGKGVVGIGGGGAGGVISCQSRTICFN